VKTINCPHKEVGSRATNGQNSFRISLNCKETAVTKWLLGEFSLLNVSLSSKEKLEHIS
jgi:hypothetical protein